MNKFTNAEGRWDFDPLQQERLQETKIPPVIYISTLINTENKYVMNQQEYNDFSSLGQMRDVDDKFTNPLSNWRQSSLNTCYCCD